MLPPALIGFNLEEAVSLLARTPATLDALLRDLPDDWIRAHEGDKTWSSFDVVAHLIHADRTNWIPRARIILDHGEVRPFDEFDRFAHFAESLHDLDHVVQISRVLARQYSDEVGPWQAYLRIIREVQG